MTDREGIPYVAILVSTTFNWGRGIVDGILTYSQGHGPWHVRVKPRAVDQDLDRFFGSRQIDGVIANVTNQAMADQLISYGVPVVNVSDQEISGFSAPCFRVDDTASTRLAAEHFVSRGFQNIAFAAPSHRSNPKEYAKAFEQALGETGRKCHIYSGPVDGPGHAEQYRGWLESLPKPVGVLVWGVGLGYQTVDCCLNAGISVPHDVSVLCGSDDALLSKACFPPLSGIRLPLEEVGFKAAATLQAMLSGDVVPNETTFLPPQGIHGRLSTDTLAVENSHLRNVVQYLKDHAFQSITMDDVMKHVPVARSTLERQFKKAFGHSPMDELRHLRIQKARELLVETDLPMADIAEACGYSTYNYLTRIFKQETGAAPRDFRATHRVG